MEQSTSMAAFTPFAKAATYTPPGSGASPLGVLVIIDKEVERWSLNAHGGSILNRKDEATFRLDEVRPARGGTLTQGASTYMIGELVEDDGILITVTLRSAATMEGGQLQAGLQSDLG